METEFAKIREGLLAGIAEDATGTITNNWYTENASLYDKICKRKQFFRFHEECLKVFKETVIPKDGSIIDFAMGTGVMGELLRDAGYTGPIDGVDRNTAMMDLARPKNIYRNIWTSDIGMQKIDYIEDGSYDYGTAASCLGRGQVELTSLPTMVRTIKKGGYLVCTLSGHQLQYEGCDTKALKEYCVRWDQEGTCHLVSCVDAMHTSEATCHVFVLRSGSKSEQDSV